MKSKIASLIGLVIFFPVVWLEQTLFNSCVAATFGLPVLTYWKMVGIDILIGLLTMSVSRSYAYERIIDSDKI